MLNTGRRVLSKDQSLSRRVFEKTWNGVQRYFRYLYAERQTILLVAILSALTANVVPDASRCQKSSLEWLFLGFYQETTPDYQCIEQEFQSTVNLASTESQTDIKKAQIESENSVNKARIEAQAEIEKARIMGLIGVLEIAAPHLRPEEMRKLLKSVR